MTVVVALGDSLTCGEGVGVRVRPEDTWVALLARALPAGRLVRLAVPGARVADVRCGQLPLVPGGVDVATLRTLLGRGVAARLVVAGDGPLRPRLQAAARDLPVEWLGFVADRARLAGLLAGADVVLAPGPIETFGLAALEALACGTPVVADSRSALPGVLGPHAGRSATGDGAAFADAVQDLLATPEASRRAAARDRAEEFSWPHTVRGFLAVHESGRPCAT